MAARVVVCLTATLFLASALARSLRMPESRFASLEGLSLTDDASDGESGARLPRHPMDFAEFDLPLSAYNEAESRSRGVQHRSARGVGEGNCGCADNPELFGEIVDTAPSLEDAGHGVEFYEAYEAPSPARKVVHEFVEVPEERAGFVLSADDAHLDDDLEATLCDEGLHPADFAPVESCAGRPARHTQAEDDSEVESDVVAAHADKKEVRSEAERVPDTAAVDVEPESAGVKVAGEKTVVEAESLGEPEAAKAAVEEEKTVVEAESLREPEAAKAAVEEEKTVVEAESLGEPEAAKAAVEEEKTDVAAEAGGEPKDAEADDKTAVEEASRLT